MTTPVRLDALLADAISIPTYARPDNRDEEQRHLRAWHSFLERSFPTVHTRCERTVLSDYAIVFRLPASGPGTEGPVLLTAHYDVVPADDGDWSAPPFAGAIQGGAIWGRGALDDKLAHLAIMEALETLIQDGFSPRRDIYLAFGGDEETGGDRGACSTARFFKDRNIEFDVLIDEGTLVAEGVLPGIPGPVAVIGTAEKGHAVLEVTVRAAGGHAAHPERYTAADRLAQAIAAVARRRFPVRIVPAVRTFVRSLGRHVGGITGAMLRLFPITAPVVIPVLASSPETDALLRDTRSVTVLSAASAPNVVAERATALYNVRLLPGSSVQSAVKRMYRIVRRYGATVQLADRNDNMEAPRESPATGDGYDDVAAAIRTTWGEIPILPYLFTMTTDSRHYQGVAKRIYRFLPIQLRPEEIATIHSVDEHVSLENVRRSLTFFRALIESIGGQR